MVKKKSPPGKEGSNVTVMNENLYVEESDSVFDRYNQAYRDILKNQS